MSVRRKLFILLLVIALVPLLINGLLHRLTIQRISQKLSTETREVLQENATKQLQTLVKHQALLLKRDRGFLFHSLDTQAREVEGLLAAQVQPVDSDLEELYLFIRHQRPDLFLWQATFLESGQKSLYPANASSLKSRPSWYDTVKKNRALAWQLVSIDSQLQIIASKPVFLQNGDFGGATAISLKYQELFRDWKLPPPWNDQGRLFIVTTSPSTADDSTKLKVLLEISDDQAEQESILNAQSLFDAATASGQFNLHRTESEQNGSGVQIIDFDSKESIWVYEAAPAGEAFPLLVIPRDRVSLPARKAAGYVEDQFIDGLKLTGLLTVGVLFWVIVTAVYRARAVTEPIAKLSHAAERLSQGDFASQVNICSNDEFEKLGNVFNRIGPQLKERQEIKQSLAVAQDIQQLMLPDHPPQLEKFDIAGRLDYCDETGGDYYDFIKTESGKWGLAVGDVVGHGVGSALLMTSAAGILHAAIANGEENLSRLFSTLNTFLEKDVGDTRFMTLFFAFLNQTERSLKWLSAGHGPTFLYRATTGSIEEFAATTMPLGVMGDVEFKPVKNVTLESGDILAIGTDGIWETNNPSGEMFGTERVGQLLKELSHKSAEEIISEILQDVEEFRGSAQKADDLTLIVLKAK